MRDEKIVSQSSIDRSGNSDVDVKVIVDTSPLAYALACYMYVEGKITQEQYEMMVKELEKIQRRNEMKGTQGQTVNPFKTQNNVLWARLKSTTDRNQIK